MTRIIIKATADRGRDIEYLRRHIPEAEWCFDEKRDAFDTFMRALRMAGDDPAIHMEEDVILSQGFRQKIEAEIAMRPGVIIQFFGIRRADIEVGSRWDHNFNWNQCIYLPKGYARLLIEYEPAWKGRQANPTGTDTMIADFLKGRQERYWIHAPSLVQHRQERSLINARRSSKRQSMTFVDPILDIQEDAMDEYNTTPEETQQAIIQKGIKRGKKAIEKKLQSLSALTIEYVPIGSIKPNDYNPNRQSEHDFELLCRSMQEDGFTQPIIVIRENREIVDGEHRWRAAQAVGHTEIPVVFVDMTPEQARISTLRHNRARGTEDFNLSAAVLRDLQELGAIDWAQDSLMLSDIELNRMLEDVQATDLASEDFSMAWEPDKAMIGVEAVEGTQDGDVMRAGTATAVAGIRERERRLREAKTQEERVQIRKDMNVFRISLIFSGEEAELVKGVLGPRPAEKLVLLCKEAVNGAASDLAAVKSA